MSNPEKMPEALITVKTPYMKSQEEYAVARVDPTKTAQDAILLAIEGLRKVDRDEDANSMERILKGRYQIRVGDTQIVEPETIVSNITTPKVVEDKEYQVATIEILDVHKGGSYSLY
jgi:hypothetical protein